MKHRLTLHRPEAKRTRIQIRATIEGRRIKMTTGVSIDPNNWDAQRCAILNDQNAQDDLNEFVSAFVRTVMDMQGRGEAVTAASLKARLKRRVEGKPQVSELTVNEWITEFMDECEAGERITNDGTQLSFGRLKHYRVLAGLIHDFTRETRKGRHIAFEEIDSQFVSKFIKWRTTDRIVNGIEHKGVNVNTLRGNLKMFKAWVREAYDRGVHQNRAAWESKIMNVREVKTVKVHLTPEEINALATCDLSKRKRKGPQGPEATAMVVVRDMFVLACWTGARISDIKRMPEMVSEAWKNNGGKCPDVLSFVQAKTNAVVKVPVLPGARDVIEHYRGALPSMPSEPKVNKLIKELIPLAGIDRVIQVPSTTIQKQAGQTKNLSEMVSFHTARRSFATNMYNLGVLQLGELRALTGHTTEAALMTYLNVTQTDVSKRATDKLLAAFK